MKPKILRKPKTGLMLVLVLDFVFPLGAVVLDILRGRFPYTYSFTDGEIVTHDPLAWYGIVCAVGMGALAVLTGFVIAAIVSNATEKKKFALRIMLTVFLLIFSLAVLGVSSLFALKIPTKPERYHAYKDESGMEILITEQPALFSGGEYIANVFLVNEENAELLATTNTHKLYDDDAYTLSWVTADVLAIAFEDNGYYRTLQIIIPQE